MVFGMSFGKRICGVYKMVNTANGKLYVGSSTNIESRIRQHVYALRKGVHHNVHLRSAFSKYGERCFVFSLLEACAKDVLLACEQRHLDALSPAYNICAVAGNTLGYKHGAEAKLKMSQANAGNKRMLGKHHTEETKRLIGAKAAQRTPTDAQRAKISAGLLGNRNTAGKSLSPEHKAKVSAGLLGAWATCRSREEAAERLRANWADPVWKAQQAQKIREGKAAKRLTHGLV
jgi:group I intron endonuclease